MVPCDFEHRRSKWRGVDFSVFRLRRVPCLLPEPELRFDDFTDVKLSWKERLVPEEGGEPPWS
eukprot:3423017-Prymnesium_polylepis.1